MDPLSPPVRPEDLGGQGPWDSQQTPLYILYPGITPTTHTYMHVRAPTPTPTHNTWSNLHLGSLNSPDLRQLQGPFCDSPGEGDSPGDSQSDGAARGQDHRQAGWGLWVGKGHQL